MVVASSRYSGSGKGMHVAAKVERDKWMRECARAKRGKY